MTEFWGVLAIALLFAGYVGSLYLHPWTTCSRCRGSGKHRGVVFTRSFRACAKCGGSTRQPRFGRRFFGGPP